MGDKVRVAVVFGGRSAEHAISCVSAGSVIAALDPDRYEVVPVGITPDGGWVLADPDQRLAIADGELPEVSGGTAVSLVGDPGGPRPRRPGPGRRDRAGADRGRRRLPRPARRLRRGRDDPGPAGDGRAALRGVGRLRQRGVDGQGVHQEAARGGRPAAGRPRRAPGRGRRRVPRPRRPGRGGARAAGAPGLREAVAGGVEHRDHQGHRLGAVPRRRGDGGRRRPEGDRRGVGARAGRSSAAVLAPRGGGAAGGEPARGDPAAARRRLVRLRGEVPRRRRSTSTSRPT